MEWEVEGRGAESGEEVRRKRGRERWGRGGRWGRRQEEEKRTAAELGSGLKMRGPRMGLSEGFERRRGGLKTDEIGKRDFHSSGIMFMSTVD